MNMSCEVKKSIVNELAAKEGDSGINSEKFILKLLPFVSEKVLLDEKKYQPVNRPQWN